MKECVDFKATDPRDMVFALLGLASDAKGIEVDYNKSLAELKQAVAKHFRGQMERDKWRDTCRFFDLPIKYKGRILTSSYKGIRLLIFVLDLYKKCYL
jgi:hypothetical protein